MKAHLVHVTTGDILRDVPLVDAGDLVSSGLWRITETIKDAVVKPKPEVEEIKKKGAKK
jgi:hypothetical protein